MNLRRVSLSMEVETNLPIAKLQRALLHLPETKINSAWNEREWAEELAREGQPVVLHFELNKVNIVRALKAKAKAQKKKRRK